MRTGWKFESRTDLLVSILTLLLFSLSATPCAAADFVKWKSETIVEKNKKGRYEISAKFPQFLSPAATQFNKQIKDYIRKQIATAKKDFGDANPDIKDETSTFTVDFKAESLPHSIVSIVLYMDEMTVGAAHPSHLSKTFAYEFVPPLELTLDRIFKTGTPYVKRISQLCIASIKKTLKDADMELLNSGAGPNKKNFQKFRLHKSTIEFLFDQYEVACYAAGPQSVSIPYAKLKQFIITGSPVHKLATADKSR